MRRERLKLRAYARRNKPFDLKIRFAAPSLEANVRLTALRNIPVNPRLSAAWWQSGFEEPVIYRPWATPALEPPYFGGYQHFDA